MICGHCIFFRDGFCRNPKSKRTLVGYFREKCDYYEQSEEKTTMQSEEKTPKLKRCCHCHRELPLEAFGKRKMSKDGRQSVCKECRKGEYQRTKERRIAKKAEKKEVPAPKENHEAAPEVKARNPEIPEPFLGTLQAITRISDQILIRELARRGWKGRLTKTANLNCEEE